MGVMRQYGSFMARVSARFFVFFVWSFRHPIKVYTTWIYLFLNQYYLGYELKGRVPRIVRHDSTVNVQDWVVRGTLIKETQSQLSKLKEKVKSIEHRFSTHQVQEIMKKEEKDHKKIHLLKKQVALMHGEHQEFDKDGFKNPSIFIVKNLTILVAVFGLERSQNHWPRSLSDFMIWVGNSDITIFDSGQSHDHWRSFVTIFVVLIVKTF